MISFSSVYFEQLRNVAAPTLTYQAREVTLPLILQQPQPEPKFAEQTST